jgi:hypothetical protein
MSQPALVIFVIDKCMLVLTITFLEQFGTYNCLKEQNLSLVSDILTTHTNKTPVASI